MPGTLPGGGGRYDIGFEDFRWAHGCVGVWGQMQAVYLSIIFSADMGGRASSCVVLFSMF